MLEGDVADPGAIGAHVALALAIGVLLEGGEGFGADVTKTHAAAAEAVEGVIEGLRPAHRRGDLGPLLHEP
ncbi:MAG: hypothetical protein IPK80_15075 [Nannocystis sp.]|jgi:hypothetical protein|nr:hypothetical protein [Nannocystis sp.]MBK8262642.1 hypothetical protein [Nannocystis sp.]